MRYEISLERYKKLHQEDIDKYKSVQLDIEEVWDYYHMNIYPLLPLIAKYRNEKDLKNYATEEQIKDALCFEHHMWYICKKTFKGLRTSLKGKNIKMGLLAQATLLKAMKDSPNAKIIEMGLIRYDEEYKPKGQEVKLDVPKTIDIKVVDASVNEEDLDD